MVIVHDGSYTFHAREYIAPCTECKEGVMACTRDMQSRVGAHDFECISCGAKCNHEDLDSFQPYATTNHNNLMEVILGYEPEPIPLDADDMVPRDETLTYDRASERLSDSDARKMTMALEGKTRPESTHTRFGRPLYYVLTEGMDCVIESCGGTIRDLSKPNPPTSQYGCDRCDFQTFPKDVA